MCNSLISSSLFKRVYSSRVGGTSTEPSSSCHPPRVLSAVRVWLSNWIWVHSKKHIWHCIPDIDMYNRNKHFTKQYLQLPYWLPALSLPFSSLSRSFLLPLSEIQPFQALSLGKPFRSVVPNLFGTRDQFHGRQFFCGWGDGFSFACHCLPPAVPPGS